MQPTSPPASVVIADYDRALLGLADRPLPAAAVYLLGKYRDIADSEAADLGCDLGRDSNVRAIEDIDRAYVYVHEPVLLRTGGASDASSKEYRHEKDHQKSLESPSSFSLPEGATLGIDALPM
jgi:hypothetical protein